jgi:hypothetical protein
MTITKKSLLGALVLALVACGGGGGGGSDSPTTRPEGTAQGKAQHGPIRNAIISAFEWSAGEKGRFYNSTTSDDEGKYLLGLDASSTHLLVSTKEGQYPEESNGRSVSMGNDSLKAIIYYEQGKSVDVQLTYFTTLAACRAEYLVAEGATVGNAVTQANSEFSAIIGESITGTEPVDTTKAEAFTAFMTPAHRYGIAVAGISLAVDKIRQNDGGDASNDIYTVKHFTNLGCKDILADGELNGIAESTPGNPSGQLYLGSTAISTETYRRLIATSIIEFGDHENNKTGLAVNDLLEMANSISLSSSALFGGEAGQPVDNTPPVISVITTPGTLLAGESEIVFNVQDPLGVLSIEAYLDGDLLANIPVDDQVVRINTALFADGHHDFALIATDVLGNRSAEIGEASLFTYHFLNSGAGLVFDSPTLVNNTEYVATGTFEDNGAGIDQIVVDGVEAVLDFDNSTFEAEITLTGNATNLVQGVITDTLGNSSDVELAVDVDIIPPSINDRQMIARFTDYSGQLNLCEIGELDDSSGITRPVCLNAELVSLNGATVSGSLTNDGFVVVSSEIGDSGTIRTSVTDLDVEYTYIVGDTTVVDWSPVTRPVPNLQLVYVPITTEYFGSNFYQTDAETVHTVKMRVTDNATNSNIQSFSFKLDVLTPAIEVTPEVKQESLFSTAYQNRQELNLETYRVEYTYNNESSLPYVISIDPQNRHLVTQNWEGAIRKNRARQIGTRRWVVNGSSPFVLGVPDGTYDKLYKWTGDSNVYTAPEQPATLDFVDVEKNVLAPLSTEPLVDVLCASQSGYTWRASHWHEVGGSSHKHTADFWSDYTILSNSGKSGACNGLNFYHGSWYSGSSTQNLYTQVKYEVEYEDGYPRNDVVSYSETYGVSDTEIVVVNKTLGTEIFPINGWYKIPPNTQVEIVAETELPLIHHKTDIRVGANDDTVPFGSEVFQDTAITWEFDTDIEISRAIDPGDIGLVSTTSQTVTMEGFGVKSYSITR